MAFVGTRTDLWDNVNGAAGSTYYADSSFSARAHSAMWGTTFIAEIPKIRSQVSSTGANTLLIMLGSNDLAYKTSPSATLQNLELYIGEARAANTGIDIVIGRVLTKYDIFNQVPLLVDAAAAYNAGIETLAARLNTSNARVVTASTDSGWTPGGANAQAYDGTHPNPTGEKVIAQGFSVGLSKIGVGTSSPDIRATTAWSVPGPTPTVASGSESATLGWQRVSTGASGMYIEQRLTNNSGSWERLPYPVSGNSFSPGLLAAGGTYQFRLAPSKGLSTGVVGASASTTVTGPQPAKLSTVGATPQGDTIYGGKSALVSWGTSTNASGYVLSSQLPGSLPAGWTELPYPVSASTHSWTFVAQPVGRRAQYGVRPTRGYLTATRTESEQ